ncbi:hypothetical protein ACIBEJ_34275 [Nonomuraea sp. NPDC050790]|uniref:hypothetical protein n=1 Tax=Nonomuraea sp. NPDC050790 TaxID=3364371 RepID=UPI0037BC7A73
MATVPSQRTWTVGELLTAAKLNTDLRDAVNFLLAPPLALLRLSADINIPNATLTAINWNTEVIDRDGGHDNSTNPFRYTFQTAGYYEVATQIAFNTNGTGLRLVHLYDNNYPLAGNQGTGNSVQLTCISAGRTHFFNVGEYILVQVYQNSGAPLGIWAQPGGLCQMSARWVSKN